MQSKLSVYTFEPIVPIKGLQYRFQIPSQHAFFSFKIKNGQSYGFLINFEAGSVEFSFKEISNFLKQFNLSVENYKLLACVDESDKLEIHLLQDLLKFQCEKLILREEKFEVLYEPYIGKIAIEKNEKVLVKKRTKILIVDDSETIRKLFTSILGKNDDLDVVAAVDRPSEAIKVLDKNKIDVMLLDVNLPEMTGIDFLKKYHRKYKVPTLMISSLNLQEAGLSFDALENGAFDFIQKPDLKDIQKMTDEIIEKIKIIMNAKYKTFEKSNKALSIKYLYDQKDLILIGSSTGGTEAIKQILTSLPANIPPIVITQHIPAVFSAAFAQRLAQICKFKVSEAKDGDLIENNHVYIAPGGTQMKLEGKPGKLRIRVTDDLPVNRHKPSVDYLFSSAAKLSGFKIFASLLTGMGADGARGLLELKKRGAQTVCQNEESCVVFGMPREGIKLGAAEEILHLNEIAFALMSYVSSKSKAA